MDELEELLKGVPPLVASLQAVREEDSRHSQYVTAMDSLKHIFTVPESVAKTKQWIGEGKLLHAHQVIKHDKIKIDIEGCFKCILLNMFCIIQNITITNCMMANSPSVLG